MSLGSLLEETVVVLIERLAAMINSSTNNPHRKGSTVTVP